MIDAPSIHQRNNESARLNDVVIIEIISDFMKVGIALWRYDSDRM